MFHPTQNIVAAACMDGTVWVHSYELVTGTPAAAAPATTTTAAKLVLRASTKIPTKHEKYVKTIAWWNASTDSKEKQLVNNNYDMLASGSADGTVQLHKVSLEIDYTQDDMPHNITMEPTETLYLRTAVESLCFIQNHLCCYARERPYLMCFDVQNNFAQRKINLNHAGRPAAAGTTMEDQHVSFAVMDMAPSPNNDGTGNGSGGKYLALATDANRNIVLEFDTGLHVRNLYGHKNDGFSNPKITWSRNGQYIMGNTQEDASVCIWDVASSNLVERKTEHGQTIRDMFASATSDILVTTSFDKQTRFWFASS